MGFNDMNLSNFLSHDNDLNVWFKERVFEFYSKLFSSQFCHFLGFLRFIQD